jgi:uncharacterized membrane protein YhaH (DUF805 family)
MESLALFFSARGRVSPRAFAAAVAAVYGTAFLSQLLISAPVMLHAGLSPFALVQAIAIWAWFCLHAKRLRDADRGIGAAVAIAVLYVLAVILFLLLVALIMPLGDAAQPASAGNVLALFFLVTTLMVDPGLFAYVAAGIFALVLAPVPVAIAFSIWAATRPAVTNAQPSPAREAARCVAPDRSSANRTG